MCVLFSRHDKTHFMKYVLFEEAFLCHFCMSSRVFVRFAYFWHNLFVLLRFACTIVHSLSMRAAKMNVLWILGACPVNSYEFECNLITPKIDPHNKLSFLSYKWTNFYLRINGWSMKLSCDFVAAKYAARKMNSECQCQQNHIFFLSDLANTNGIKRRKILNKKKMPNDLVICWRAYSI